MITADLHEDVVKYIINDITMSCRRLGIDTVFYIKDYGYNDERIISTSFQTMPVLFKEIHLEGSIQLEEHANNIKFCTRLYHEYKTFNDDEGSLLLGGVIYVIDKSYTSEKIRNISMYIDKVKGINI